MTARNWLWGGPPPSYVAPVWRNALRTLRTLFENNRRWADRMVESQSDFFGRLTAQQAPDYLWIGCSDSRVPANQIVGLLPGELFVHRNVANVVVHSDLNCLSVLQYAVDVLRINDIIVCGHYGCGGVRAALEGAKLGLIDNWLRHVQDVRAKHRAQVDNLSEPNARLARLCELNVIEQAVHVCETTVVQDAWARGRMLAVHALIYGIEDGLLRDLGFGVSADDEVLPAAEAARAALARTSPGQSARRAHMQAPAQDGE
jgi:carbonic anhydrase